MPIVEVTLPDELLSEFEQAVEELLTMGIDAYNVDVIDDSEPGDDFMDGAENNLFDTASDPGDLDEDTL
jgi:hypothetical protein